MTKYLAILLCLVFISCKEAFIITHYDNGEVYEKYQYKGDSLKHGPYWRYNEGGVLLEESVYNEGYLEGIRKIYNDEGWLEIEETHENKEFHGPYRTYHKNGKVKFEGSYTNNVLQGTVKVYYPSGKIKEEVTFVDNQENGPFLEFHENGNLMWRGTYRNGDNEYGLLEKFDEEGKLVRKMMCDDDARCKTTWTIEKEEG